MRKLYKFYVDYGRSGELEGLFVADERDIIDLEGKTVYFGEVLGKHSDVELEIEKDMFTEIDVPEKALKAIEKELGATWSGFNPVEIYSEQEEEENE